MMEGPVLRELYDNMEAVKKIKLQEFKQKLE